MCMRVRVCACVVIVVIAALVVVMIDFATCCFGRLRRRSSGWRAGDVASRLRVLARVGRFRRGRPLGRRACVVVL